MFEFKHPKYYKELRKLRNKLDPAISDSTATANDSVRPGPGYKLQATSCRRQATSVKRQAKRQATSAVCHPNRQATGKAFRDDRS